MRHLANPWRGKGLDHPDLADIPFPSIDAAAPLALLERCPAAARTPLHDKPDLAETLGLGALWVKDERVRMGLGSFKALGAAYVIACEAEEGTARGRTYVTASAGNHGLSVAAGARVFGAKAKVFIAEQVPQSFARRLEAEGAEVIREGSDYEASMAAAAQAAEAPGHVLLSDSSWPGYFERPHRLMEGYLALMAEVFDQMAEAPTHIMLQAGVGGLAGAAAAIARAHWGDTPRIIVVEPENAPALLASVEAGAAVHAGGPPSCMGRLDCKEPSLIALKGLARDADDFVTITEAEGQSGADLAARSGLESTPSGAAGLSALAAASDRRDALGLGPSSRVLTILSEQADS
ncbi:pyridoxal-phosphate dependent enzyme [Lutimaribacter marinistellae]|uniref:Pyridoxal-phosphate dependent enzyme n=1 Tax=Lutimaribacter marinistellae TaxID=1820329 RepID=A0ABV7TGE7_9RHOB